MFTRPKVLFSVLFLITAGFCYAQQEAKPATAQSSANQTKEAEEEPRLPALPSAVAGNAVAVYKSRGTTLLFSMMGMGAKKTWEDVTNTAFYLDPDWDQWYPLKPVPGTAGRIDAAAMEVDGQIFLIGGVVVDPNNRGTVVPDVNIYDTKNEIWLRGKDLPLPVANAVIGVYRDRYIYLLGGRSNRDVTSNVQIYDTDKSRWFEGTPLPGQPVFGHAGAVMDDTIVFVDGAYKNPQPKGAAFLPADQCWMGKIDHHDPAKIEWSKIPPHPGDARFGIAAGASDKERKIYFTGGTDNPDADTGLGYDGKPAEPVATVFAWDLHSAKWETINETNPNPTMNNQGLLFISDPEALVVVGGMGKGQVPSRKVTVIPIGKDSR